MYIRTQTGYSLLEILVSLIILAIGLLGLSALQTAAMRFNHDSYLRSIAITQVNSMADRMRVNRNGIRAGNYNNLSGIPASPSCTTACSSSDIAQRDLFEWNTINAALLPQGQGAITGVGNLFTITVRWDNERTGATGLGCSGNNQVDLSCLTMSIRL